MNFESYSIVITGLGGQGLIRLLQILGNALMIQGYKVMTFETHGLSQRGGKVTCVLRFGDKFHAPLPIIGIADMIIALEESTILDVLRFAKPDKTTNLIISTYEKHEIGIEYPSLEDLLEILYKNSDYIYFIPAMEIALKYTSNLKTMNTAILGYILRFLPLNRSTIEESIMHNFSGEALDMNLKALNEGINL